MAQIRIEDINVEELMDEKELQMITGGRMNPPPRVQGSGSSTSVLDWVNNGAGYVYCQDTGSGGGSGSNANGNCNGWKPGSKAGSLILVNKCNPYAS